MGWFTQDKNEDTHTQVKSGEDKDGNPQTEFVIANRDGSGHDHVAINDQGDTTSHTSRSEK